MSWILWALSLSSATPAAPEAPPVEEAAPECTAQFTFVGQPECVQLTYDDGRTRLDNGCSSAVLVDQSVQSGGFQPVPPGTSVHVKDLSAFTLAMDGELFLAVAQVDEVCAR